MLLQELCVIHVLSRCRSEEGAKNEMPWCVVQVVQWDATAVMAAPVAQSPTVAPIPRNHARRKKSPLAPDGLCLRPLTSPHVHDLTLNQSMTQHDYQFLKEQGRSWSGLQSK